MSEEMPEVSLRDRAVVRLKKKREFQTHLLTYIVVNGTLVAFWAVAGAGFFWPVFPILGWGIGLIFHAVDVYSNHEISEEEIQREMKRMMK